MQIDPITLITAVGTIVVSGVAFAFVISNRVTKLEEKVSASDILINHLVKAGENIKDQLKIQEIAIAAIQKDIGSIDVALKAIMLKLEKYDQNIVQFYRDFDRHEKEDSHKSE